MVGINGWGGIINRYDVNAGKTQKNQKSDAASSVVKTQEKKVDSSEEKLSAKAKEYLKNLREKYKDYDLVVADPDKDTKDISDASDKEITVIFDSDELEKMAEDEEYGNAQLQRMESAIEESKKLNDQLQAEDGSFPDGMISKITIEFDSTGNMKIFAELEKSSAMQKERIEANKEKQKEEKKAEEKKTAEQKAAEKYSKQSEKSQDYSQKTSVEASSFEELLEKIKGIDWSNIPTENINAGDKIDFTV